jgi:hypothetical protein
VPRFGQPVEIALAEREDRFVAGPRDAVAAACAAVHAGAESGAVTVVRFGISRFAQSAADWPMKAQRAEQCGFDVLWASDHLFHFQRPDEPVLDEWVTLAAWAATTTRIRPSGWRWQAPTGRPWRAWEPPSIA